MYHLVCSLFLTVESVDLLLFQPETAEEQFHFYLQRVNGRLEGCKECFDWLLSAEEFHSEPNWLGCMKNHAVQLSDIQHALKMVDIICMQRQLLCSDEESTDIVYRDMKEVMKLTKLTFIPLVPITVHCTGGSKVKPCVLSI